MPEPPTPKRPAGITLTTLLMALCLVAEFVIAVRFYLPVLKQGMHLGPFALVLGYMLVFKLISATIVFSFWRGRDWALWVVMLYAAFRVIMPFLAQKSFHTSGPFHFLVIPETLVAAFLLYYLNTRTVRAWFH